MNRPRLAQQGAPRLGERGQAPVAIEERHAEDALQIGNRVADRRLGAVERARRGREAALLGDEEEDAELVEGDRVGELGYRIHR